MPVCKRCSISKPVTDFYAKDTSCKACRCQYQKEYRETNPDKVRQAKLAWKKTPAGKACDTRYYQGDAYKAANKRRKKTFQYQDFNNRYARNLRIRRPEAPAAHDAVKRAIKTGKLKREPCVFEQSGDCRGPIHAHHQDYSRPLDVMWLCREHHKDVHELYREQER